MKLSKKLKQDNDCGDFGKALNGYSELMAEYECLVEAVAHIGVDFGYGVFELDQGHIDKARYLIKEHHDS